MKNILSILNLQYIKENYPKLDMPLKQDIFKRIGISIVFALLIILYCIFNFNIANLLFGLGGLICSGILVFYPFYNYLTGNYCTVDGTCISTNKPAPKSDKTLAGALNVARIGKSTAILSCNGNSVEIPIANKSRIIQGVEVRVYFHENNIYQVDPDYYKIVNPIAIDVLSTKNRVFDTKEKEE